MSGCLPELALAIALLAAVAVIVIALSYAALTIAGGGL